MSINYKEAFHTLYPDFFEEEGIRTLPADEVFEELVLDLRSFDPQGMQVECPAHITFGMYEGDVEAIREAVRLVDEDWAEYFNPGDRIYCAFDGDRVVSFCLLDEFGCCGELRVGGPGCVGTVPAYRRMGIGLKMVHNATAILQADGFDLSWIHYTHVGPWYAHLGYRTVVRWNCAGVLA